MVVKFTYSLACAPSTDGMVREVNALIEKAEKDHKEIVLGNLITAAYFGKYLHFSCPKCKNSLTRDKLEETKCDNCGKELLVGELSSLATTLTQQKGMLFMKEVLIYGSSDISR